ncbi:MAG: RNA polymerase Rpb4 family protein [Thermoplasmatales archaeon]|nr:RNA polymerase Rpb4 family protein [Thermoplasmatales archaeon]
MRYVSIAEVKKILEKEQKDRELSPEQKFALEHTQKFAKLNLVKTNALIEELRKIEKMPEPVAYKIADLLPTHPDDIKVIFAKERVTLDKEETERILDIVKKYVE